METQAQTKRASEPPPEAVFTRRERRTDSGVLYLAIRESLELALRAAVAS
jgi:hypothetical protein